MTLTKWFGLAVLFSLLIFIIKATGLPSLSWLWVFSPILAVSTIVSLLVLFVLIYMIIYTAIMKRKRGW